MTKMELVRKIRDLLDSAERMQVAVDTALEESKHMIEELEKMPELAEEITED